MTKRILTTFRQCHILSAIANQQFVAVILEFNAMIPASYELSITHSLRTSLGLRFGEGFSISDRLVCIPDHSIV
jgi:hypothetical protein